MNDERFAARCNVIDHQLRILEICHSEYGTQNWYTIPDHEVNIIHKFWATTLRSIHLGRHMLILKGIVKGKLDPADEHTLAECIEGKYKNNLLMRTVTEAEYNKLVSQRHLMLKNGTCRSVAVNRKAKQQARRSVAKRKRAEQKAAEVKAQSQDAQKAIVAGAVEMLTAHSDDDTDDSEDSQCKPTVSKSARKGSPLAGDTTGDGKVVTSPLATNKPGSESVAPATEGEANSCLLYTSPSPRD